MTIKKEVKHPEDRSVDLQSSPSSEFASEVMVKGGASVEVIDEENGFSKVIIEIDGEESPN